MRSVWLRAVVGVAGGLVTIVLSLLEAVLAESGQQTVLSRLTHAIRGRPWLLVALTAPWFFLLGVMVGQISDGE